MGLQRKTLCIAIFLTLISLATPCEPDEYICSSGECLAYTKTCNGIADCDDGSDEDLPECVLPEDLPPNCTTDQFRCDAGDCIALKNLCDGRSDCFDDSDENKEQCGSKICQHSTFRCDYGACINASKRCDGERNCMDGSDESEILCGNVTTSRPRIEQSTTRRTTTTQKPVIPCIAPQIPNSVLFFEADTSRIIEPGEPVENGVSMRYTCKSGYNLEGTKFNLCLNSEWRETLQPVCIKYCPPLKGVTFDAACEYDGNRVSCEEHIRPGTRALITCQRKYKVPEGEPPSTLLCLDDGNWDHQPFRCVQTCGEEPVVSEAFLANADRINVTQVPWHVGIYHNFSRRYKHICGGTIIQAKIIITAAHCFWDYANQKVYDKSHFAVAAGKYFRDFYLPESHAQMQSISKIDIPSEFYGEVGEYDSDIAVVVLNDFLRFNAFVAPACISWKRFAAKSIPSGVYGRVAGWGKTENGTFGEELRSADLPATSYTDCKREAGSYSDAIHDDKFCVLNRFGTVVCQGDSGGGYAVKERRSGKYVYYLWGVVSGGVPRDRICPELSFVVYTNIQFHKKLIEDNELVNRPK